MTADELRLGIDGGGSRTRFLLVDRDDRELARVETGPSNWLSVGKTLAGESLSQGIAQLPALPDVVCGGFAGAGSRENARFFSETLQTLVPRARIVVETDVFIAYVGALGLAPGTLVIAGTGSIALTRRPDGAMIRVGGWGPVFGDEGSGFWIGREAVREALRAADHQEYPDFVAKVERALEVRAVSEIVSRWASGGIGVSQIASLAPVVIKHYPEEPARRIIDQAAAHLRALALAADRKIDARTFPRSIVGSIGADPLMRQLIGLDFIAPIQSPERGAIAWGRTLFP
ncbi:MAG TPA: BadF/BadG/BcrA/BcrD ATPase family protein [Terriglobia bacterium]|nr:BadF/BadG/BcrA/BcrD ATPase family protein [Terriglobia bacterium]